VRPSASLGSLPSPLLVFSPHLDDAVLSVGCALAERPGSVVATVLTGIPADESVLTEWDRACGFTSAGQAVRSRWLEDARALQHLRASPVHLGHVDGQYGAINSGSVAAQIADLVEDHPDRVPVGPLGIGHPDHRLISEAFLAAMIEIGRKEFWLFAEIPALTFGAGASHRTRQLASRGVRLVADTVGSFDPELKRAARDCYRSQLARLGPLDAPELIWKASISPG